MERFFLPLILIFLKFALVNIFSLPWPFFEPLLFLVILYTFFHSFDTRDYVSYAFFCGFLREVFSADAFGVYVFAYLAVAFCVALVSRIIYRENQLFVFPMVFLGTFLGHMIELFLKGVFVNSFSGTGIGMSLLASFMESLGNTLLVYLLYLFSKKCGLEFTK